jgi:tetratricopeptide (TPR) repeat protein
MKWVFVLFLCILPLTAASGIEETPRALIERGAWKQARGLLEQRLQANPGDAEALCLMSRVRNAFGDTQEALELAEKAVALDGQSAAAHLQLAEMCGQKAQKSGVLKQMGLGKRFKKEAETAIALDPKQIDARFDLMMFYCKAPGLLGGDKKKATAMADAILALDAVQGSLAHARLALEQRDSVKAEGFLRKAVETDPKSYEAQMVAANFYLVTRKWDQIERFARAARLLEPHRVGAYSVLAQLFAHLERWSDLDAVLQEAEAGVPNNMGSYYQAGRVLLTDHHDLPRAERYFRTYLASEPEGNAPTLAHARWRLGLVLEAEGHKPEAIAEIETALRLKPDLDDAKKDLKRLR